MEITLIGTKLHSYCIKCKDTRAQTMERMHNLLFEGTIQPPFIMINRIMPPYLLQFFYAVTAKTKQAGSEVNNVT